MYFLPFKITIHILNINLIWRLIYRTRHFETDFCDLMDGTVRKTWATWCLASRTNITLRSLPAGDSTTHEYVRKTHTHTNTTSSYSFTDMLHSNRIGRRGIRFSFVSDRQRFFVKKTSSDFNPKRSNVSSSINMQTRFFESFVRLILYLRR